MQRLSPIVPAGIAVVAATALAGCTQYEYVITDPTEFAGHLTNQERTIERPPVTYHLVDQSSRVGVRIENPSDDAILIKGEESYLITPDGQSRPLKSGTIAAHTWAGFTIPPVQHVYHHSGLSLGFGVGTWGDHGGGGIGVGYDPMYDDLAYAPTDEVVWPWKEGPVHMHLVLQHASDDASRVEQDFTIDRRKVQKD